MHASVCTLLVGLLVSLISVMFCNSDMACQVVGPCERCSPSEQDLDYCELTKWREPVSCLISDELPVWVQLELDQEVGENNQVGDVAGIATNTQSKGTKFTPIVPSIDHSSTSTYSEPSSDSVAELQPPRQQNGRDTNINNILPTINGHIEEITEIQPQQQQRHQQLAELDTLNSANSLPTSDAPAREATVHVKTRGAERLGEGQAQLHPPNHNQGLSQPQLQQPQRVQPLSVAQSKENTNIDKPTMGDENKQQQQQQQQQQLHSSTRKSANTNFNPNKGPSLVNGVYSEPILHTYQSCVPSNSMRYDVVIFECAMAVGALFFGLQVSRRKRANLKKQRTY